MADFPTSYETQDRVSIRKTKANPKDVDTGNRQHDCATSAKKEYGEQEFAKPRDQRCSDQVFAFQDTKEDFGRKNAQFATDNGVSGIQKSAQPVSARQPAPAEGKFFAQDGQARDDSDRICLKNQRAKLKENAALDDNTERVSLKKPKATY